MTLPNCDKKQSLQYIRWKGWEGTVEGKREVEDRREGKKREVVEDSVDKNGKGW